MVTNRITAGLTRIERARGFLEAATLSEAWGRDIIVKGIERKAVFRDDLKRDDFLDRLETNLDDQLLNGCRPSYLIPKA